MLDSGSVHLGDEADRVVRKLLVAPVADGRLHEGLVRIGGRGLELGAANDDAVVRLADDVEEHVRVLLLRALRAVAFGVGVGRDVKGIERGGAVDVVADVLREGAG